MACIIVARESGAQTFLERCGIRSTYCTRLPIRLSRFLYAACCNRGLIALVSGSTVTVSGTAGWTSNQFVYSGSDQAPITCSWSVRLGTDPRTAAIIHRVEWRQYADLELNGDDISSVPAGCTLTVYPYWTLATVFPPALGTSFIASTSPFSPDPDPGPNASELN